MDKLQNENKKDEQEKESFENLFFPKITEPDEKKGKISDDEMVLRLEMPNLGRLLFNDLGVKFFLLNEHTVTVKTNKILIGGSQIKPIGRATTHRASRQ